MSAQNNSADLLEGAINNIQQEFAPKLRRYIDRFIDIFNHSKTQVKIRAKWEEAIHQMNKSFDDVIESYSFRYMRKNESNSQNAFRWTYFFLF